MIVELSWRWPFVRQHVCHVHTLHGTPHHAHRSWVMTEHGVGWIHHHDTKGYWVEFSDGRIKQCPIEHIEAPK